MRTLKEDIDLVNSLIEVTIIDKDHKQPLKDNDTVKVYHGTSNPDFILSLFKYGLSGDMRANRAYSYEYNNNPKGLFVTPDMKTAKYFGQYIIEFHAKVSDLEAPVWPNGSFTVQGGYSGVFDGDADREQERLRQRDIHSKSDDPVIKDSDRPELASIFLQGGERQALFRGDIDPNSITAIWIPSDPKIDVRFQTMIRMDRKQFIKFVKDGGFHGGKKELDSKSSILDDLRGKMYKPREDTSLDDYAERLVKSYKNRHSKEEIIDILIDMDDKTFDYYVRGDVWNDRQYNQIMNDMKKLKKA